MLDATGMAYGVLVQVSVHGTDNRLLIRTLKEHPSPFAASLSSRKIRAILNWRRKNAGVVGLRLNSLYGGGIGFDEINSYGALCRDLGWHLQLLIVASDLPPIAGRLSRLSVPFVVDHMGHFPTSPMPQIGDLLDLVADWVPDPDRRHQLFVENPHRLYGFPAAESQR